MNLDDQLRQVALTLSSLIEICPAEHMGDLLDLVAGSLASILKARELRYEDGDRIGKPLPDDYYPRLAARVRRMAEGTLPPHGRWISGYYFNSAVLRLGASRVIARDLLEAIDKLNGTTGSNLPAGEFDKIYEEYRKLKHALRALRMGRNVSFEQAVASLSELVNTLERRKPQLANHKTKFPNWKNTH